MTRPAFRSDQRGAALLVVLMFSALLAGLAGVALRSSTSGARAAMVFLDAMRADDLGRSVADAVVYRIATAGPSAKRGGAFTIHLAQADLDVDYRSESARVDVNKAPVDLITAVLAAAGAEPSLVAAVADRIAAFRGPAAIPKATPAAASLASAAAGGSSEEFTPTAAKPAPSGPAAALIQNTLEIVRAWGLPEGLARRVLPVMTIANGSPKVDPILADRLVLSALLGGDDARIDDYLERRSNGFGDADSATALLPITSKAFVGFADVSAVRALARVTIAHRFERRYEIVLDPPNFPGGAPKILSWEPLF